MARFWTLLKNVARIGLPVAAVKVTYDQGVWEPSTDKGRKIFEQAKHRILPGTIEYPKKLPTLREMQLQAQSSWNYAVQTSFYYITTAPEQACQALDKLINSRGTT